MSTKPDGVSPHRDAQQQYEQLVASLDGIVWEVDAQTFLFTFVSRQAERLLGYPLEQWFKPGFWVDHLHPEDRAWALEFCLRATREKRSHDFEYRMIAADGRAVWLRDVVSVIVEGDVATKLRGVMVDVTERKRAEEAIRRQTRMNDAMFLQAITCFALLDRDFRFLRVNEAFARHYGKRAEDFAGRKYFDAVPYEGAPTSSASLFEEVLRTKKPLQAVARPYVFADQPGRGTTYWDWILQPILDELGEVEFFFFSSIDVTERERAAAALRESEARFRVFVDHATDAIFLHDADGTVLDVNRQACASLGYTRDELIGMSPYDFDVDVDRAALAQFGARLDAGEVFAFDTRHRRRDGTVFPVEVRVRSFWEGGRRYGLSLARDATERKRAEGALREMERQLRALVENLPDFIARFDRNCRRLYVNPSVTRAFGLPLEHFVGKSLQDLAMPGPPGQNDALQARIRQVAEEGLPNVFEAHWQTTRGERIFRSATYRSGTRVVRSSASWPSAATSPSAGGPRRRCGKANRRREIGWPKSSRSTATRRSAFSPSTGSTASRA
jgi:PAS domain S-box-containing protein